jgi:hypothetical protein
MKTLNADLFTWEKSCLKVGFSSYSLVDDDWKPLPGWTIVGVCDANKLTIRPKPDGKAMMLEAEDGEQVWLHIPSWA